MDKLPPNPILEFNPNQLEQVRKLFNYEDIKRLHQDISIFEDWIKMQHHFLVKEYDKEYLERYLIHSKGSIERAKKLFDRMCTLRGLMPEYLQGFDVENEFQDHNKIFFATLLPKPTSDNNRILFYTVRDPEGAMFSQLAVCRFLTMNFHYLNCHDYTAGVELVWDCRKFTLGMISKLSSIKIAHTTMIMTEAIGLRLRGVHLISDSKLIDIIFGIVKQGMSKKLQSRLHVHNDFESLFKLIPKDKLPKDIGGDLDTTEQLTDKSFREFCSPTFIKQMKFFESAATDESKRLSCKFNEDYSGMPGSFKVLTVD